MAEEIRKVMNEYAGKLRDELGKRIRGKILVKYNEYSNSIYIRVTCDENLMVEWSLWNLQELFHNGLPDVDSVCSDVERALITKIKKKYLVQY